MLAYLFTKVSILAYLDAQMLILAYLVGMAYFNINTGLFGKYGLFVYLICMAYVVYRLFAY